MMNLKNNSKPVIFIIASSWLEIRKSKFPIEQNHQLTEIL